MDQALSDFQIILTRPYAQSKNLQKILEDNGAKVIIFPCFAINKINLTSVAKQNLIKDFQTSDFIIFITQNAAYNLEQNLAEVINNPKIISMGQTTTKAIENLNLSVNYTSPPGQSAKDLLNIDWLQNIKDKKITILKGSGGLNVLQEGLKAKGAIVTEYDLYVRQAPEVSSNFFLDWDLDQNYSNNIFVFTCVSAIENLLAILPDQYKSWVFDQHWVVVSDRIGQAALKLGLDRSKLVVASSPTDQDITDCILSFVAKYKKT